MHIRPLNITDQKSWQQLGAGYLDYYQVELSQAVTQDVWRRLLDDAEPLHGFVAENEGKIVGFTHYFFHGTTWQPTSYCYLEDLYVDPSIRSSGAGRALIKAVKDAAKNEGSAKLYWHTDKQNETAQALYNKAATLSDYIRYEVKL